MHISDYNTFRKCIFYSVQGEEMIPSLNILLIYFAFRRKGLALGYTNTSSSQSIGNVVPSQIVCDTMVWKIAQEFIEIIDIDRNR